MKNYPSLFIKVKLSDMIIKDIDEYTMYVYICVYRHTQTHTDAHMTLLVEVSISACPSPEFYHHAT